MSHAGLYKTSMHPKTCDDVIVVWNQCMHLNTATVLSVAAPASFPVFPALEKLVQHC